MELSEARPETHQLCEWIEPGLREISGQDPLGLQTITTDRILPGLLPGVLALSRRARYFTIYSFLLRQYERTAGKADNSSLDLFIRGREFELSVAARLCANPDCDARGVIGNLVTRPLVASAPSIYERRLSIESRLGGYGLYYRSPMEEFGLVIPAGYATLDEQPTPIDVLAKNTRAQGAADAFEHAIETTVWYRDWMHGVDPIPVEVLEELSAKACVCRLPDHPAERAAIRSALLESPGSERVQPTEQRRRAFALLLEGVDRRPEAAADDAAFRQDVISAFELEMDSTTARGIAEAQWAATMMRECLQDSVSTIWHDLCRTALARQPFEGFTSVELDEFIEGALLGDGTVRIADVEITASADTLVEAWLEELESTASGLDWESIRAESARSSSAVAGLASLLLLSARIPPAAIAGAAWAEVASVDGDNQPGLLRLAEMLNRRRAENPTIGQLLRWVVRKFIVAVHESVATSKLPESTFRFFWEHGRLQFIDNGVGRFELSGLRRDALSTIAGDLGWWAIGDNGLAEVTADGRRVIAEVFGP